MTSAPTPETFKAQIAALTAQIAGRPLDAALDAWLNANHAPGSPVYDALRAACQAGVAAGWLCEREGGGIRYGRVFKPCAELHGFSVDVVDMTDIAGPHHVHPTGEIDLVMPIEGDARFDGRPAGWLARPAARTGRRWPAGTRWSCTCCPKGA
jgi:hypothetical protein